MGRFLLFVLVAGAVALYFTNPSTDEVRTKLAGQIPAAMTAPPGVPAPPAAPDQPVAPPAAPTVPGMPAPPAMPAGVPPAVTDQLQGEIQFDRKDYYLFSVYKLSVGGQQLPGCVIGIAKQVMPYDKC